MQAQTTVCNSESITFPCTRRIQNFSRCPSRFLTWADLPAGGPPALPIPSGFKLQTGINGTGIPTRPQPGPEKLAAWCQDDAA